MSEFKAGVINSGLTALKKYGISGFDKNWSTAVNTFPIASLIYLLGSRTAFSKETEVFSSNAADELKLLLQNLLRD